LPLKVWSRGPGHEKGATKIGVQRSIPDLWCKRIKILKRYWVVPGRVVDKDIDAAECPNSCLDRGVTRRGVDLVEMNKKALSPCCLDLAAYLDAFIAVP
jgi:hypothetical protein